MSVIVQLAFESMGIVYGDLGTSPLYVYASIFADGIKDNDDILGVFSLIFYTITLVTLVKYVFIVLRATDNGDWYIPFVCQKKLLNVGRWRVCHMLCRIGLCVLV